MENDSREYLDYILENNPLSDDTVYFESYSYDTAIVGISNDDRFIYSYTKMVKWLIEHTEMTEEEAIEWIDYNTLSLCHGANMPIIMYDLETPDAEE